MNRAKPLPLAVAISLVLATLLTLGTPVSIAWTPSWFGMLAIYWSIYFPNHISLGTIFLVGLLVDGLTGALLGSHSLGFLVVAYIGALTNNRLIMFTELQRTATVFVLIGLSQLILNWALALRDQPMSGLNYLLPTISSALVWPLWVNLLHWLHPQGGIRGKS